MSLSFAHLWQQQASSDMDVILLAAAAAAEAGQQEEQQGSEAKVELASFPAHSAILSNSAVLWCRVLRWQDELPTTRAAKRARTSSSSSDVEGQTMRSRLELELQDPSEQEAALAVLQSLYAVKPLPELLSELSHEQQLQAAVLADKWAVPHVSSAAAQLLAAAAKTPGALAEAVRQRVMQDPALPDCLQPLLKCVLLSSLGDLEAVWADAGLRDQLLALSLPAMELLLSSDELKVASEDTVLYTARQYANKLEDAEQQRAQQLLAPLIRCPHLSPYWLSGAFHAAVDGRTLLSELRPQIGQLLLLRDVRKAYQVEDADLQEGGLLAGAPASWALGCRVSKLVRSVQVVWQLDVSELRDAARRSASEQCRIEVPCDVASPPLRGIAFNFRIRLRSKEDGVHIDLSSRACNLYAGMFYMRSNLRSRVLAFVAEVAWQSHTRRMTWLA